jgi:hypothetical protein
VLLGRDGEDLGEVRGDPVVVTKASIVDEKDLAMRDPAELAQPASHVTPVMHSERGEGGAEGTIGEGKSFGHAAHHWRRTWSTLTGHDLGGLESNYRTIGGLVVASSGADVEYRLGIAQGADDPCLQAVIGLPDRAIPGANALIKLRPGSLHSRGYFHR